MFMRLRQDEDNLSIIEAIDEQGDIIGHLYLELVPHAGKLWVAEEWRHQGVATKLFEFLDSNLVHESGSGYYVFPSNEGSKSVCRRLGLEPLGEVWKREF